MEHAKSLGWMMDRQRSKLDDTEVEPYTTGPRGRHNEGSPHHGLALAACPAEEAAVSQPPSSLPSGHGGMDSVSVGGLASARSSSSLEYPAGLDTEAWVCH